MRDKHYTRGQEMIEHDKQRSHVNHDMQTDRVDHRKNTKDGLNTGRNVGTYTHDTEFNRSNYNGGNDRRNLGGNIKERSVRSPYSSKSGTDLSNPSDIRRPQKWWYKRKN